MNPIKPIMINTKGRRYLSHVVCNLQNVFIVNCLILFTLLFAYVMRFRGGIWPLHSYFEIRLTEENRALLDVTYDVFHELMSAHNLTYFIVGGTLIGSYRHHGYIPWDDDIDVFLNGSEKDAVKRALSSRQDDGYFVYASEELLGPSMWKFYNEAAHGYVHRSFKWPYVDIFFWSENATHICYENEEYSDICYLRGRVFPLTQRPFERRLVPAPCDTYGMLADMYDMDICRSPYFSHSLELPVLSFVTKNIPCTRLEDIFPFVHRQRVTDGWNETLSLRGYELGSFLSKDLEHLCTDLSAAGKAVAASP